MVLPLQKLCLNALRDSLKERPNPHLHEIPPPNHRQNLRQDLIDLVLASAIIKESAYTSLSSPEFLDGFSKFNSQRGITSDGEFLDRVADSFSLQQNRKTIGAKIIDLKLNIYVYDWSGVALNLDSAVRVISQCPNLKILHLSFIFDKKGRIRYEDKNLLAGLPRIFGDDSSYGILNMPEFAPCLGILGDLEELSLSACTIENLDREYPTLIGKSPNFKFRSLKSLHLTDFMMDANAWKEILMTVRNSLIDFEAYGLDALWWGEVESDKDWILPFPLPKLRSFKVVYSSRYTSQLIKNLMKCPELEKVEMLLQADYEEENAIRLLSQMNVSLEIGIHLWIHQDGDSDFTWVNLFKEKIKRMDLYIERWTTRHSTALKNMFAACSDLVELSVYPTSTHHIRRGEQLAVALDQLVAAVNSDLAPFLRDPAVVSKLRKLELFGPFDHVVLDALFEHAANLQWLKMEGCPQLSDSHLQLWASGGGKPEHLDLRRCFNVTDYGLVPLLISSGQRLKYFEIHHDQLDRISISTVANQCPFVDICIICFD